MHYLAYWYEIRYSVFLLFLFFSYSCEDADDVLSSETFTQEMFKEKIIPKLKEEGKIYRKYKKVLARKATIGEKIVTVTADGVETVNVAKEGDYVVKNQTDAREMYIISAEKFIKRYEFLESLNDGFSLYKPIGKVVAIELNDNLIRELKHGNEFLFIAAWGEEMIIRNGDYIVSPLGYNEVYRIARKEFFETYELDL